MERPLVSVRVVHAFGNLSLALVAASLVAPHEARERTRRPSLGRWLDNSDSGRHLCSSRHQQGDPMAARHHFSHK